MYHILHGFRYYPRKFPISSWSEIGNDFAACPPGTIVHQNSQNEQLTTCELSTRPSGCPDSFSCFNSTHLLKQNVCCGSPPGLEGKPFLSTSIKNYFAFQIQQRFIWLFKMFARLIHIHTWIQSDYSHNRVHQISIVHVCRDIFVRTIPKVQRPLITAAVIEVPKRKKLKRNAD